MLRDMTPHRLSISPDLDCDNPLVYTSAFAACASELADLDLEIWVGENLYGGWEGLKNQIYQLLDPCRISDVTLRVVLSDDTFLPGMHESKEAWLEICGQTVETLHSQDVGLFAKRTAERVPSLQRISLTIPYNSETQWKVIRAEDGGCSVERLSYQEWATPWDDGDAPFDWCQS